MQANFVFEAKLYGAELNLRLSLCAKALTWPLGMLFP